MDVGELWLLMEQDVWITMSYHFPKTEQWNRPVAAIWNINEGGQKYQKANMFDENENELQMRVIREFISNPFNIEQVKRWNEGNFLQEILLLLLLCVWQRPMNVQNGR